jgi:hypothetical protein
MHSDVLFRLVFPETKIELQLLYRQKLTIIYLS